MKLFVFGLLLQISISSAEFKLGIENIPSSLLAEYTGPKRLSVGLVTNQTGKDQKGNRSLDILLNKNFKVVCLFAPEHGVTGKVQAEKEVRDSVDLSSQVPVISLYAQNGGKKIDAPMLKNIDAFFFDIQDSGMRHYTYISTLYTVLKAAAQEGKKIVVFDRPNPLGKAMEGPLVDAELLSFISIAPIPLRHGMTIGEIAEYFNNFVLEKKADLKVVEMKNYNRDSDASWFFAPLSPNIACTASCHGYSFLGLLGEIKPFDVGVGTPQAFQLICLPESLMVSQSMWDQLALQLKKLGIVSTSCRYMHEHKKEYYQGLRLQFDNINKVSAFNAFLVTATMARRAGIQLIFNTNFDKAAGSKYVRLFLNGAIDYAQLVQEIKSGLFLFLQKAQTVFKYLPHPELL